MSEDRKREAKAWTLVGTSHVDAEECTRSTDDRISKGQSLSGKKMRFCTHHNRFNHKHACRTHVNEISVKGLEESRSRDHGATLEDSKRGLPIRVKKRASEALESNESVAPKHSHTKTQAEEMSAPNVVRKLIKNCLTRSRRSKRKDAKSHKSAISGANE